MLPGPRTRLHRPRRPYMHRAHLRRCGANSVMVLAVPYARWTKIELVDLGVLKTSMHANMLARARHGRLDEMLLLLTLLEVRAYLAPRAVRRRHPRLQKKRWPEPNCSWITLQRRTRSTIGGPPFRVSSASPTATLPGNRARRSRGKTPRRKPVATRPVGVPPPCTPRPEGQDRRLVGSTSTPTPRCRRIDELVAINAKFFKNGSKSTLVLASSPEEKRDVNQTSALGPLSTCMRQGNQETCRTR